MSRVPSSALAASRLRSLAKLSGLLLLTTTLTTACGEDTGDPRVSVLVDRTSLTVVPPGSTRILVTALDGQGNPPPLRTGVTLTCFSTTGQLYGELAGPTTGVGLSETLAVGDAEFFFTCGAAPADVVCQAAVEIGGAEGRGTSAIISCQ
jgi:hypothetical protein